MPNPRLTKEQLLLANELLNSVRLRLNELSKGDSNLLFALRRKIAKELTYDERGKPSDRAKLKKLKFKEQNGICPICCKSLPDKDIILDRRAAIDGYTPENTQLVHRHCDWEIQKLRNFS